MDAGPRDFRRVCEEACRRLQGRSGLKPADLRILGEAAAVLTGDRQPQSWHVFPGIRGLKFSDIAPAHGISDSHLSPPTFHPPSIQKQLYRFEGTPSKSPHIRSATSGGK